MEEPMGVGSLAVVILAAATAALPAATQAAPIPGAREVVPCSAAPPTAADPTSAPDYYRISLVSTSGNRALSGSVSLSFAASPFSIAVSEDGHYVYDARVQVHGIRPASGIYVVWATTPELDAVVKLGVLDEEMGAGGRISFNKFIVFVTVESTADVEKWTGPIVLRGISRSGLMQSMAGHSVFEQEPC